MRKFVVPANEQNFDRLAAHLRNVCADRKPNNIEMSQADKL